MKRFTAILLLLLCLCGCARKAIDIPVSFYYCTDPVDYNDPEGVISPEIREKAGYENDLTALLDLYIRGPVSEGFLSPFPTGLQIKEITVLGDVSEVHLSSELSCLTGHRLTVACVCITMTVIELTGCERVRIRTLGSQLDGRDHIELSRQDLIFSDNYFFDSLSPEE